MLLFGEKVVYTGTAPLDKWQPFAEFILVGPWYIWLVIPALVAWGVIHSPRSRNRLIKNALFLLGVTLLFTFLAPFPLHSHYIFPTLTLICIVIGLLPFKPALLATLLLTVSWLTPANLNRYTRPAPRTIAETVACIKNFCHQHPIATYASTQSDFHAQHDAKEFEYLFNRFGCQATDITLPDFYTDYMSVVVDHSRYIHGQTAYNELTLFGPSQETDILQCTDTLQIHLLEKN
jgi:hypothetical protein